MDAQPTDEDLMRRAQAGDSQAFELLYERYRRPVESFLYQLPYDLEDVELVGQEVFLRAFRFAPTYRYPQKFSTWLFTIARNLAVNWSRWRKRSPIRNIPGGPSRVATQATDGLEKQDQIARVLKGLESLPTDQKEVIVLGIFQDLSYGEMEEITGTKAVTLRSRMFHGLKRLYERYKRSILSCLYLIRTTWRARRP